MSGLGVNLWNSNLYAINIKRNFTEATSTFLSCKVADIPFNFLGIKLGSNPRRIDSWGFIVDTVKRRLTSWRSIQLSLGGRATLINSTLNTIHIFSLSFYRVPIRVRKELENIQQNFLWGGSDLKRKVHWVSWRLICNHKDEGGLGVKDIDTFNKALLCKWKWRILVEDNTIWYELIKFKYGKFASEFLCDSDSGRRYNFKIYFDHTR